MSTENITKFSAAVSSSPEFQAKVRDLQTNTINKTAQNLAALSVETGFPFTAEEFLSSATSGAGEITDEQLNAVAGGMSPKGAITLSVFTLGFGCAVAAIASQVEFGKASSCI